MAKTSRLTEPAFSPTQFTKTEHSTGQDKADFVNKLLRFIEAGFPRTLFTKTMYRRLSNCFGHIAHCDIDGFYGTWFIDDAARLRWVRLVVDWRPYGDPAYTFRDAETEISTRLRIDGILARLEGSTAVAIEAREREDLTRLIQKYPDVLVRERKTRSGSATFLIGEETSILSPAGRGLIKAAEKLHSGAKSI